MQDDRDLLWTEKEKREILRTRVFTVTERKSVSPEGLEGTYIVNDAPDWVIVIAVDGDNFLMVKQWRHGEKALSIEFPGGIVDPGEDPAVAAGRELLEETGAVAKEMIKLGKMNPNPALFSNHVHVFLAKGLSFSGRQDLDKDEYLKYLSLPQKDVIKNMGGSDYPHALMAGALALFLAKRDEM